MLIILSAPTAPPRNFDVTAASPTSVRLSWSLPPSDKQNGIIKGFKVRYFKTSDSSSSTIKNYIGSTLLHTMDGLDMYTDYSFKVLAYTIKDGPYTNLVTEKTHEGRKLTYSHMNELL